MSKREWDEWFESQIERLESMSLLRSLAHNEPDDALHVRRAGRRLTVFSTNDYLGLSSNPSVVGAGRDILQRYGNGPRGSPLVCGYTTEHAALELELARLKEAETALLFPTGFAANVSVLASLAGEGATVFSDELNHASIIDGCRLARRNGAKVKVYRHCDTEHLSDLLDEDDSARKLVVSDSVFSMDGDLAPLQELAELGRLHDALIVIDEAHATLVYGENGGGVAEHYDVADGIDIHVGTLSKAFGSQGGFVATSSVVRRHLLNRGRPYVFSTALPLPLVASARAALEVARDGALRRRLFEHVAAVRSELDVSADGPIVPVVLGGEKDALRAAEKLREARVLVPAIRPPTVPEGTSRLRVTLSAGHTDAEVGRLIEVLKRIE